METAVAKLLNGIYRAMPKMGNRAKDKVFTVSLLLLFLMMFADSSGLVPMRYLYCYSFGCLCLGVTVLASLRGEIAAVRFRRPLVYIWMLFGLLQVVSAFINSVDYLADAVMFLAGFPIVYAAWGSMGFDHAFRLLRRAVIYSFIVMLPINAVLFPMTGAHYNGLFANENGFAFYLTAVFVYLLPCVFSEEKSKKCAGFIVLEGICAALLYYSNSRSGQLASLVALAVFLAMEWKAGRMRKKQLLRLLILAVACVLLCLLLFPLLAVTLYVPRMAFDEDNRFRLLSMADVQWGQIFRVAKEKMQVSGLSADNISSGRIALWAEFLRSLNWTGHETGFGVYVPSRGQVYATAHNYFLQQAVSHGIPAGLISLMLLVYAGILTLVETVRRKSAPEYLFTLTMSIAFGAMAMLTSMEVIYTFPATLVYFLAQGTVFIRNEASRDGTPEEGKKL